MGKPIQKYVVASIGTLCALLLMYFGWFFFEGMGSIMPNAFAKTIYWVGAIGILFGVAVFTPYLMIVSHRGTWKNATKGFMWFVLGCLFTIVLSYVMVAIVAIFGLGDDLQKVVQIFNVFSTFMFVIVIPQYHIYRNWTGE